MAPIRPGLLILILLTAACGEHDAPRAEETAPPPAPGLEAAATTEPSVTVAPDTGQSPGADR